MGYPRYQAVTKEWKEGEKRQNINLLAHILIQYYNVNSKIYHCANGFAILIGVLTGS
jgi:hypothetical protein